MPQLPQPTIPYEPYDPLASEQKRLTMRNLALAGQAQELENESRQNDLDEYRAYQDALQNAGGDLRSALPAIIKAAPNRGMTLQKALSDWDTADLNRKKELLDIHQKKVAGLAQLAGTVTDEQSKQFAVDQAQKNGRLDPVEAEHLRQTPYSPDLVKGWQQAALTAQEQIQNQQKALEDQKRSATTRRKRERFQSSSRK